MNVYDFDNTIYDGESTIDFFFFVVKKKKIAMIATPIFIFAFIMYKSRLLTINCLSKTIGLFSKAMVKYNDDMIKYINEFWNENSHKLKPLFLDMLNEEDVIITCLPDFMIDIIKEKLKTENIICTKINKETGELELLCFKNNKVFEFQKQYPDIKINKFYTDSFNDISFMKLAKETYIVKKDKIKKLDRSFRNET